MRAAVSIFISLAIITVIGTLSAPWSHAATGDLELTLSEEASAAINAGVALSFDSRYAVRDSKWFFTRERGTKSHRFTLKRHALSNRYIVKFDKLDTPHMFRSITEATNHITTQSRILLETYSSETSLYSLRISLDKFALPTPMRLKAFVANAWDLDTGWIQWASVN